MVPRDARVEPRERLSGEAVAACEAAPGVALDEGLEEGRRNGGLAGEVGGSAKDLHGDLNTQIFDHAAIAGLGDGCIERVVDLLLGLTRCRHAAEGAGGDGRGLNMPNAG